MMFSPYGWAKWVLPGSDFFITGHIRRAQIACTSSCNVPFIIRFLTRTGMYRQILIKLPNFFFENLFSGSRACYVRTDMTKLFGIFLELLVAKARKNATYGQSNSRRRRINFLKGVSLIS
jgi:hypothetical protein